FNIVHGTKLLSHSTKNTKPSHPFFKKYNEFIEKIADVIEQCMKENILMKNDKHFLAFSLLGQINHNIIRCVFIDNFELVKDLDKKVFNLFMKGAGK
ncbi:MAG: hypothetical protein KKH98_00985, partial [Spirochaetes bacterium]|nr:hypothetical protein [Spirochaetota bacterium]